MTIIEAAVWSGGVTARIACGITAEKAPTPNPSSLVEEISTQTIEIAAGSAFKDLGMDLVAGDDPIPPESLREYLVACRS
ncbi:MAG: hypothetical protein WBA38_08680 [Gordonia sp. (in: high G+C Gram-positive bacteria)]|uniref:hypothetical protein n=1 Tax=Gordonia sp. (in: high G+C Gram-positive bacteria) TaxID=84139 RepID=UPI003C7944D2